MPQTTHERLLHYTRGTARAVRVRPVWHNDERQLSTGSPTGEGCAPMPLSSDARQARLAALTEVNLDDLCDSLGLKPAPQAGGAPRSDLARKRARALVRWVGRTRAATFAALMLEIDDSVGRLGYKAGSAWGLGALYTSLRVVGAELIPATGPVLFLANHPGMTDTLALFAAIPRAGLRTIAARRAFLQLLPHLSAPLLWLNDEATPEPEVNSPSRLSTLRAATAHLRAGGALLTFPAGKIEPDPAVWPHAATTLDDWNHSTDVFARLNQDLVVVPTLVSGVISARAAHSPLRFLRRDPAGRDLLSAMLQLSWPPYKQTEACVRFGAPLPVSALSRQSPGGPQVARAAAAVMRSLMVAEARDRAQERLYPSDSSKGARSTAA